MIIIIMIIIITIIIIVIIIIIIMIIIITIIIIVIIIIIIINSNINGTMETHLSGIWSLLWHSSATTNTKTKFSYFTSNFIQDTKC